MFGKIGLAQHKQAGDRAHQVVVHPQAPHRVVGRRIDPHRPSHWVIAGDALIHLKQVAVARGNRGAAVIRNGVVEIQIHRPPPWPHPLAAIAELPGPAGGHIPGHHVSVGRVLAFEEIIALRLGNRRRRSGVIPLNRQPHPAVVAQALAHQGELALEGVATGDAGGMDLGKAGIGKQRPLAMGRPNRTGIGFEGVGGEVVDVRIAAARQQHRMGRMGFEGTGEQVAADDAPGHPIHRDQLEHVPAGEELHLAGGHLAHQGLVGPIEQLLAGLTAGVKGAAHQGAAKVAVGQGAAVLPGEGHALGHALVDDAATDFGEAVAAGLPGPEVAALERVGKEPLDAVAIVGVILGGVDAALGCHRMGPAGAVVEGDQLHPVALLRQGGRRRGPGQATAHHQHLELALAQRTDQRQAIAGAAPGIGDRARGNAGIG